MNRIPVKNPNQEAIADQPNRLTPKLKTKMPLNRQDAERALNLLWELLSEASSSEPESTPVFNQAISSLHLFLSDILPASQPCIRAKVKGGIVEIRPRENTPVRMVDLEVAPGDKVGIVLDSINVDLMSLGGVSPIVISLVSAGSVAARDGRLGRGDQILEINGHSLRMASLERARWLLESAARKGTISMATLPYALLDGLKHSISRHNLLTLTPTNKYKRSRSLETINKIHRNHQTSSASSRPEVKRSKTDVATRFHRAELDERYTPSIGSRSSKRSVVSSTVEVAAHLARSSIISSKIAGFGAFKKRKVRKMHVVKCNNGLGIRIVGGKGSKHGDMGIFVNQMEEGGAANKDSRLKPGDELLMVDGKSLVGLTHAEAVEVLKSTQRLVQLVVATEDDGESMASSVQSIPELMGGQRRKSRTAQEIAPEIISSPNRAAFEMAMLRREESDPQPLIAETEFTKVTVKKKEPPMIQNNKTITKSNKSAIFEPPIKTIVYIKTGGTSLGFSLCGGRGSRGGDMGILVRNIDPNGLAGQDGRLKKGDEILEVNSQRLKGCTHKEAASVIRGLKSEVITIVVLCRAHVKRSSSVRGTELEVALNKLPGQPLGIQLTEVLEGDRSGVFVKKMAPESVAEKSGQLVLYDQIVTINGGSVLGLKTSEVKGILASAPTGELRVGVVRPRNTAAVKKIITEQLEQQLKTTESSSPVKSGDATPIPAVSVLFDREDSLSGSELDDEEHMEAYVARSKFSVQKLTLEDPPQQGSRHFRASRNQSNGLSPPSHSSPAVMLTPPLGFTLLELTLRKRPKTGLGITIVGSTSPTKDLFMVRRVNTGGVASKDARLKSGDRLVSVNGVLLKGLGHAAVLQSMNDSPKDCHLVIWRDPNYSTDSLLAFSSHSGSRASLASTEEELKKVDGKRKLSNREHSPLGTLKRFSLDIKSSPSFSRHSLVREESPLRLKRWSTTEGVQVDIDTTSLDKYFPLEGPEKSDQTSGSVTPTPTPPEALPPSLPDTPLPSPVDQLEEPDTPPSSLLPTDFPLLSVSPSENTPQLPTSFPPEMAEEETYFPPEDEPQLPSSFPPEEDESKQVSFPPEVVSDKPLLPSSLPPLEEQPVAPTSTLPPEDAYEPELPSTLPPEDEDTPNVPLSVPPKMTEEEPTPPFSLPPEEEPTPPFSQPPEEEPTPPFSPPEDEPTPPFSLPPEDEPTPPFSLPPEDEPTPPFSLPPEDEPTPPFSLPPEDEPTPPFSLPPEDEPTLPDTPPPEIPVTDDSPPPSPEATTVIENVQSESAPLIPQGVRQEVGPFEICLYKSMFGLGVQLLSDEMGMVSVKKVATWSAMAKDGNIRVGDHILSVNDVSFIGKPLSDCESFIKGLPKGQVKFVAMGPPKDVTRGGIKPEPSVYTGVSSSTSGRQIVAEEGVVKAELYCYDNKPLGIEIEGGMDTPLQYVYISHMIPGYAAFESGVFRKGDQLVMVGEECIIGLTHNEALDVLKNAKEEVEIVAQRKESPKQTRKPPPPLVTNSEENKTITEVVETTEKSPQQNQEPSAPTSPIPIITNSDTNSAPISLTELSSMPELQAGSDSSMDTEPAAPLRTKRVTIKQLSTDLEKDSTLQIQQTQFNQHTKDLKSQEEASGGLNIVPEETFTIELHRAANEKLGLGITGGVDNPRLQEIHVKQVVKDCVAQKDGRLKRGDRIVSVNGHSLAGATNKDALKILKETGLDVTLVVARKIGRRTSAMTSPYVSNIHSRRGSGEHSQHSSNAGSKQTSPHTRRRKLSSGENSRGGSKGSSPKMSVRRHSRKVSSGGDRKTLPRQLSSTIGVKLVELQKGPTGVGMQLQGGKEGTDVPVTIKSVFPGGAAYKSGKIRPGDVILEANGISFEQLSHEQAIATVKSFPQGKVTLILRDRSAAH